jgi:TatD DNase family protein
MLIDTHCHLNNSRLLPELGTILNRSRSAGVNRWIAPGCDLKGSAELIAIAKDHQGLWPAVGIHPCDADSVSGDDWVLELRQLAAEASVAAVGEIGLDYYHQPPTDFNWTTWQAQQARVLEQQLEVAADAGLNVILHARDKEGRQSHADMVAMLHRFEGRLRGVFHCFIGSADEAQQVIDMGHLVSFTGVVTYNSAADVQATAKALKTGSFMIETDSPFLAPVPFRGKRCEPAHVAATAEFIAELRGEDLHDLAEHTTLTAESFFRLD